MTKPIPNHQCGFYCIPPQHAIEVIHRGGATAADVQHFVNLDAWSYGWNAIDVRPAPEADRAVWEAGPLRHDSRNPGPDACCWLALVIPLEEAV